MDRRDNTEVPNGRADDQFQKAYEVISLSYRGGEPERLYRAAISCFDSLIEISHGNETIREFAHRRSIDMKYLVDGASFVISKMHFNPENNYYITLGLPQHATPEELSRRWKKFMLLYHPDKQVGNEEWVSERAKKVNEAYTELKDETKRAEYDRRLNEQALNRNYHPDTAQGTTFHHRPARHFDKSSESSPKWRLLRPYIPKVLIAVYILIALVVLGFIYIQNKAAHLEAELVPEPGKTVSREQRQPVVDVVPNTQYDSKILPPVPPEQKTGALEAHKKTAASSSETSALHTIKGWFRPEKKKQRQVMVRTGAGDAGQSAIETGSNRDHLNADLQLPSQKLSYSEQTRRKDTLQQAEVQIVPEEKRQEPAEPVKSLPETRLQAAVQSKTELITKEEVEAFMQRYVSSYTKGDLNTFLSLFSRSAVENGTLTYNEIRNAYKETFTGKVNQYRIINMDIRTDGKTATVSGIYTISRYIASGDRWVRYRGNIVWKLVRENSQLRIISTTYDK